MDKGVKISREDFELDVKIQSTVRPSKFKFEPKIYEYTGPFLETSDGILTNGDSNTPVSTAGDKRQIPTEDIYDRSHKICKIFTRNHKSKSSNLLHKMPENVSVIENIQDRIIEINQMEQAIIFQAGPKTALQLLPKNMRRRASSHNIKRFPRSLRGLASDNNSKSERLKKKMNDASKTDNKSGFMKKLKNSSSFRKKKRRTVGNINGTKNRLNTHIWHAKRFKMGLMYDKIIPLQPNLRANLSLSYRQSSNGAILFQS